MTDHGADLLIRAAAVHTLVPGQAPQQALAVRGDRIAALPPDPNGLDHVVSSRTAVHDLPGATVLPTFDDTHTHLIFAALGAHDVPVHQARTIPEFLDLIRQRARTTPEGEWIRTTTNWQELNLAERRMPTAAELDQATDRHPVLVKRGGHNDVVNTYALRLAGITEDTPVPPGGVIGRDADGRLDGRLIDNALGLVEHLVPAPDRTRRIDGLRLATSQYAATGIGTVRDCAVTPEDYAVLLAAREAGALSTRVRALISALGLTGAAQVEDLPVRMPPAIPPSARSSTSSASCATPEPSPAVRSPTQTRRVAPQRHRRRHEAGLTHMATWACPVPAEEGSGRPRGGPGASSAPAMCPGSSPPSPRRASGSAASWNGTG
ncbi:amidohydrolase family protein [Streptomyces sp. NPDC086549]|uniref:amidohydrolase family protein n=1 Tax=Streptomyces sp. NPDC086549 TaxID=3365752 RepID=UPI003811EF4E